MVWYVSIPVTSTTLLCLAVPKYPIIKHLPLVKNVFVQFSVFIMFHPKLILHMFFDGIKCHLLGFFIPPLI